jgi:transcriptional regulator with PAS, ATPase and Fis domain
MTFEGFPDEGLDLERYMEGVELSLIRRSLERTRGNKRQAAKLLKLKRTTLIEKLKRLDPAALPVRHATGAATSDKLP